MKKKRIATFILMLSLFMTSCSNEEVIYYTVEAEDIPGDDHTKEDEAFSKEESFPHRDAINEEGLFFEKVSPEAEVTLEDIILTNEERGIKTNIQEEIALTNALKIYQENLTEEERNTLEKLNVRKLAEICYLSTVMTDYIETHTYSSLYLEEEDDLDWNSLFSTLQENAIAYRLNLLILMDDEENEGKKAFYESCLIENLSEEDLQVWIDEFHEFILLIRAEYPEFDMRRLACVLENYAIGYEKENGLNRYTYASTGKETMTYPLWDGYYPNFANFEHFNYHEFCHLINLSCADEANEIGYIHCGGMCINSTLIYKKEYRELLKEMTISEYFPFSYHFIEESTAEMKSSSFLGGEPTAYAPERFLMNTIEYSLFLEDSYTFGNIEKACIYHNPIALIEQFPIMNVEEKEWFYMQLEMLESYNVCNKDSKWISFNADLKDDETDEIKKARLITLENHADLQMMRNFIWTLINCKDKNLTVEDYDFLLHLMETRINLNRDDLMKKNSLNTLTSTSYQEERKRLVKLFEDYINTFAKEPYSYRFLDDSWKERSLSTAFTEEEKLYIEELIEECSVFQEEREYISREELIKKYYLVP